MENRRKCHVEDDTPAPLSAALLICWTPFGSSSNVTTSRLPLAHLAASLGDAMVPKDQYAKHRDNALTTGELTLTDILNKRYFRPDELAALIEKPLRTIYRWLERDFIRHVHFGRATAIPRDEVERILREGVRISRPYTNSV
jgi:excisionase family DNA binding protein